MSIIANQTHTLPTDDSNPVEQFDGKWETKRLEQVVDCLDNVRIPLNDAQRASIPGPYPYCGANGVLDYVNDFVLDDDVILIAEDGGYFDEYVHRPIAYRMKGKIWVNNHAHVLKAKNHYNQGFLYHSLAHKNILPYLSGGTRAKLNRSEMNKIELNLPYETNEQRAIAEVLSDVDGLIGALDALIAKKRAIKHATMQQLLTGKTRLPGFSGDWETKQLGELVHLIPSGIYGLEKQTGELIGMPVATTAHIDLDDRWNEKQMHIRYFTEGQIDHYSPLEGDLIVVKSSGSAASIQSGKVGYVSADKVRSFIFSNFLMLLRPTDCNAQFLFFQLTSGRVKQMLPQLVEASTYPNLRLNDYLEVQIPLPPEEEQLAIANVLSDMDAEIAALERRRNKSRAIKQGMMQQLLTGRVRLVNTKSDVEFSP